MSEGIWIVKVEGNGLFETDDVLVYAFHDKTKARAFMIDHARKMIEDAGRDVSDYEDQLAFEDDEDCLLWIGELGGDNLRLVLEQVPFEDEQKGGE